MSRVPIEFRDVDRALRPARRASQPFSDRVESGEWLGVIGPNGAGKSSLLRALAGLVPHDGSILVDGRDLASMSNKERATLVAYVPQEPLIPDDMSVFDYVLLGRTPYVSYFGVESRHDRDIVGEAIERLELGAFVEPAARRVERRRTAAGGAGASARAAGAGAAARRADVRARHRPSAAGAGTGGASCATTTGSP